MDESTHVPGKKCLGCGEVKPLTEYSMHGRRRQPSARRSRCRDCNSLYAAEYSRERREFLIAYKLERGCFDCGYRAHYAAMDFDHRPGEIKLFEPALLKTSGTWQQMLDEIAKCDVVCSNCHRIRTFERPPANRGHDLKGDPESARQMFVDPDQYVLISLTA